MNLCVHVIACWLSVAALICPLSAGAQAPVKPAPPVKPAELVRPDDKAKPTETDLRAAYCRPVIAGTISRLSQDESARQQHADALQRARRIELYILPRLNEIQAAEVLAAQTRGRVDNAQLSEALKACESQCKGGDAQSRRACVQQCTVNQEVAKRVRDCDDIAWLPLQETKP